MTSNELLAKAIELKNAGKLTESLDYYDKAIIVLFNQLYVRTEENSVLKIESKKAELELERELSLNSILVTTLFERYRLLPQISTLSSALIGLIVLNGTWIQIKWLALAAFVIMIFLIPCSMAILLYQLEQDAAHISAQIRRSLSNEPTGSVQAKIMGPGPWILWLFFFVSITLLVVSFF